MFDADDIRTMKTIDDQIKYILDNFDFETVHIAMKALGFTWDINNDGVLVVPTVDRLRDHTEELLIKLTSKKPNVISTMSGGFKASKCSGYFSLSYILEEMDSLNPDDYQKDKNYPMRMKYKRGGYEQIN